MAKKRGEEKGRKKKGLKKGLKKEVGKGTKERLGKGTKERLGKRLGERSRKGRGGIVLYFLVILVVLNLFLGFLNIAKARGLFIPEQPVPAVVDGVVDLDAMTLQQKIAQMVVTLGIKYYSEALKNMQLGGIHLHAMRSEDNFKGVINHFQEGMEIPFMVTADLEGCVNPFAKYKKFEALKNISSVGAAFEKGKFEGKYLKELGFTVDFAPVVDIKDDIWKCRSFPGDATMISELANAYILGMQDEGILATAKHYPGKTLVIKDPHKYLAAAEIEEEDLQPYKFLIKKGTAKAIMVSHIITYGEVNSEGKPSVTSERIIKELREEFGFDGLIITDEINMQGVKKFYDSTDEMYVEVFKAGSDIVLNFNKDPNELYNMIKVIEKAVLEEEISEEQIDASVKRILEFKGFKVKD